MKELFIKAGTISRNGMAIATFKDLTLTQTPPPEEPPMPTLSPENQATLDRIWTSLKEVRGVKGMPPDVVDISQYVFNGATVNMIMTAVRNEALAPTKVAVPEPEALHWLMRNNPGCQEALKLFAADGQSMRPALSLAIGYLMGRELPEAAVAVFVLTKMVFPETDFG